MSCILSKSAKSSFQNNSVRMLKAKKLSTFKTRQTPRFPSPIPQVSTLHGSSLGQAGLLQNFKLRVRIAWTHECSQGPFWLKKLSLQKLWSLQAFSVNALKLPHAKCAIMHACIAGATSPICQCIQHRNANNAQCSVWEVSSLGAQHLQSSTKWIATVSGFNLQPNPTADVLCPLVWYE